MVHVFLSKRWPCCLYRGIDVLFLIGYFILIGGGVFAGIDIWHYPATRDPTRVILTLTSLVRLSYALKT
ncbi:hypothetical protein LY76DRAFT_593648, partial [Colletotrichum caudatum]